MLRLHSYLLGTILFLFCLNGFSQNTVGLLKYDDELSIGGYTLVYPERQSNAYLLNECGEIVHSWEDENPLSRPGAVAYLLENGNLLRAKSEEGNFSSGGGGGIIELVNWDNEVLWRFETKPLGYNQHHDIHYMPNGNILMLLTSPVEFDEIIELGFDTLLNSQDNLIFESIWEVNPSTDSIVWEWHSKDHLIQEFDATKNNYGVVKDHPELIDINYQAFAFEKPDWMHANSIDYNEELDQVMISVRNFNEIWIIDHSTTTAEAASSEGGVSGVGGDLLYRWGNPAAYNRGTVANQKSFRQHDAQWIDDFVEEDYPFKGAIALYNNDVADGLSLGQILRPVWNENSKSYEFIDSTYAPNLFEQTFSHPDTSKNFSTAASSIQILGNGHVVMCAARQGFSFELTPEGEVAWEYVTPFQNGIPAIQGTELSISENFTFQVQRYLQDYPAFVGKDLSPKGYIELEPNINFCGLVNLDDLEVENSSIEIFPNPAINQINIYNKSGKSTSVKIYDAQGNLILSRKIESEQTIIPTQGWSTGLYILLDESNSYSKKLLIHSAE